MTKYKKITLLGGDTRQLAIADFFLDKGFQINVWGIKQVKNKPEYNHNEYLSEALEDTDICILPLPVSREGIRLNAPLCENAAIRLSELSEMFPHNTVVFGGKIPENFKNDCDVRGIKTFDFFEDECLCIKNALLTAEAATEIAMRELPGTLDSSKSMVIGFGRIGKLLSNLLIKMNSDVTVAARKDTDLAYAECYGAKTLNLSPTPAEALLSINDGFDIVFNTVPVRLINAELISKLNKTVCLVDLASPPGGIDIRAARDADLKVIWALSLPGKYSPSRAGKIIAETIYSTLKEENL